jgi:hypothetical protein
MNYTNTQIRGAILKTADLFERKPHLYSYRNIEVPECGTPGCMLGYIGMYLGVKKGSFVKRDVSCGALGMEPEPTLYALGHENFAGYTSDAAKAVSLLRAYANKYFPATGPEKLVDALDPAFVAFKQSFARSMEAA